MLEQKAVVVTGGTGGLGQTVVKALVEMGAHVYVPSVDGNPFPKEERISVVEGVDLTDEQQVAGFYNALPPLTASIHLAGGFLFAPVADTNATALSQQLNMNVTTCYLCCQAAIRNMRQHKTAGAIVNVTARAAVSPRLGAQMSAYTAAKGAVAALTGALAEEVKADRIRVNAVAPSIIDTPTNRRDMPDADFDQWVTPLDLAHAVMGLCAPSSRAISGTICQVYAEA